MRATVDFWARCGSGGEKGEGYEAVKRKKRRSLGAGGGIRSLAAERVLGRRACGGGLAWVCV